MTRSNLSKTTVTKALNQLKANGWVDWETNSFQIIWKSKQGVHRQLDERLWFAKKITER
jgi:DNA-binding GntR family transcriptional regulator